MRLTSYRDHPDPPHKPLPSARIENGITLPPQRLRGRGPWVQLFSPAGFEWNRYELPVPGMPAAFNGFRIVHLTDVHLRPRWWRAYDVLLQRVQNDPPDLVLIAGDLLEHRVNQRPSLPTLERFLAGLQARLGIFAILGNHDSDLLGPQIKHLGVQLIDGRFIRFQDDARGGSGATIDLIGSPGVLRGDNEAAILAFTPPRIENSLRLLISHYPDTIRQLHVLRPDVMLSGHTHGGQACLPGGIPIITHDTLPRRFASGVHRLCNTWLVVGRGLGFATRQFRVFCPGEVIELVLRRT
jgi:predicted MPP superfamily phosphohydrolase